MQLCINYIRGIFGVAIAFSFVRITLELLIARRPRHRRTEDAPRIETAAWVQAMSRRIEASVSRDRPFGFVTWNY